ncbi:MAG: type II toxin-antitoxin system HipA family toxin [Pseudomonadota bacterium]
MSANPVKKLEVWRTFSDASRCWVGTLAQNAQGVFFQYQPEYLERFSSLSPFKLNFDGTLQLAQRAPHQGLQGVFADSLPDGWGLMLMDRIFRRAGTLPGQITAMDRLAFVGNGGLGALSYEPVSDLKTNTNSEKLTVADLGLQAQALFDGQTTEVLAALVAAGSSGGARPKAQLYLPSLNDGTCSTQHFPGSLAHLVKFTSSQLPLGHEEGLCEAAYLTIAAQAGIEVPKWRLLDAPPQSGAKHWLALERFDTHALPNGDEGRFHLHSACGLLDADFRMPSLDYEDLIKASSLLCKSPRAGQTQFRRAMFNLFACNQDDHSKNWAFLQSDNGQWQLAPFYDVTFSPSPYGEHATAFCGFGKQPSLKAIQQLANHANYANWSQAQSVITEVVEAINLFASTARELGVAKETVVLISRQLDQVYEDNKILVRKI